MCTSLLWSSDTFVPLVSISTGHVKCSKHLSTKYHDYKHVALTHTPTYNIEGHICTSFHNLPVLKVSLSLWVPTLGFTF